MAALVAALVVGGGGYYLARRFIPAAKSAPPIPAQLTLNLNALQLSCASGVLTWSPTSDFLALVAQRGAYSQNCSGQNWVVAILDARTGKKVKVLDPATTGQPLLYEGGPVDWMPDGKSILLSGLASDIPLAPGKPVTPVLFVMPLDGGPSRLLCGTPYDPNLAFKHITYDVWDMRAGTQAHAAALNPAPGLSYTWTPDGLLTPSAPLPRFTSEASFTGSPTIASGALSHWQPGTITPINSSASFADPQRPPAATLYESQSSLWSPDGHYYIPYLALQTRLAPVPGAKRSPVDRRDCAQYAYFAILCDASAVPAPYPDAAFASLATSAERGTAQRFPDGRSAAVNYPGVSIDWRPDGKYLATLLPGEGFDSAQNGSPARVSILRTDDGAVVARLPFTHTGGYGSASSIPFTFWSPNGKQLALFDQIAG